MAAGGKPQGANFNLGSRVRTPAGPPEIPKSSTALEADRGRGSREPWVEAALSVRATVDKKRNLQPGAATFVAGERCRSSLLKWVANMSKPESLKEVYTDEIKDLWSANDQMIKALSTLNEGVHDAKLKKHFAESLSGIGKHNETLKSLLEDAGEAVEKEHCKGMEGLCKEALKHGVAEAPDDGELKDIVVVTQYQRMCHYGITGFGSAAAIAKALGMKDHVTKLQGIVADIYGADELTSQMAEKLAKMAAKHAKTAS